MDEDRAPLASSMASRRTIHRAVDRDERRDRLPCGTMPAAACGSSAATMPRPPRDKSSVRAGASGRRTESMISRSGRMRGRRQQRRKGCIGGHDQLDFRGLRPTKLAMPRQGHDPGIRKSRARAASSAVLPDFSGPTTRTFSRLRVAMRNRSAIGRSSCPRRPAVRGSLRPARRAAGPGRDPPAQPAEKITMPSLPSRRLTGGTAGDAPPHQAADDLRQMGPVAKSLRRRFETPSRST